jgi:Bacterial Ig-like domain/Peptidase M10 serralysin C terminal
MSPTSTSPLPHLPTASVPAAQFQSKTMAKRVRVDELPPKKTPKDPKESQREHQTDVNASGTDLQQERLMAQNTSGNAAANGQAAAQTSASEAGAVSEAGANAAATTSTTPAAGAAAAADGVAAPLATSTAAGTVGAAATGLSTMTIVGIAAGGLALAAGGSSKSSTSTTATPPAADKPLPTVQISDNVPAAIAAGGSVTYKFKFSETVTGFAADDVTVSANAVKGAFTKISDTEYTLVVTPVEGSAGNIAVSVGTAWQNAAGKAPAAATTAAAQAFDNLTPTISSAATESMNENALTSTVLYTSAGTNVKTWSLQAGGDNDKFAIDAVTGKVTWKSAAALADAEHVTDANQNGVYELTVIGTAANGRTANKALAITLKDVAEAPTWVTGANDTYVSKGTAFTGDQDAPTDQDHRNAIASLLSNDDDQASWGALVGGQRVVGTAKTLTYAFQNTGAKFTDNWITPNADGSANAQEYTIQNGYSTAEKTAIRDIFDNFKKYANLTFTESTSQAYGYAGGADLRLFKDTAAHLNSAAGVVGYAYQGYGDVVSSAAGGGDELGDFFLISDALPSNAFATLNGDEKNTVSHELLHALGLDHPFNDGFNDPNTGFSHYYQGTLPNRVGGVGGGGHDTPLTDFLQESVMTYSNPAYGLRPDNNVDIQHNSRWKPGIYDVAAMQHLYGANMTANSGDTSYIYTDQAQVFDTIWDAGGNDTIVSQGATNDVIDLRGGDHLSRVGAFYGSEYTFKAAYLTAHNLTAITEMVVKISNTGVDATDYVALNSIKNNNDGTYTWIDPLAYMNPMAGFIPRSADAVYIKGLNGAATTYVAVDRLEDIPRNQLYNLGIAFGTTVENASAGAGDDFVIGNDAVNSITLGIGNDFVFDTGLGADLIDLGVDNNWDDVSYTSLESINYDHILNFVTGDDLLNFVRVFDQNGQVVFTSYNQFTWDAAAHSLLLKDTNGVLLATLYMDGLNTFNVNSTNIII